MLKGNQIYLRTFKDSDIEPFQELNNDIQNRGDFYPMEINSHKGFQNWYTLSGLWDEDFGRMLIFNYEHEMLGYINYFKAIPYFESLELGYILFDETQRGKGIVTEAVNLFTDYLFTAKKICRLEIRCNSLNIASKRVAEKCGYQFEGTSRGFKRRAGDLIDIDNYGMTVEDWKERKGLSNS